MTVHAGILWVCGTPIGNISDATERLKEVLGLVQLVVCEDTRVAGLRLQEWQIKVPLVSLEKFSEARKLTSVIAKLSAGDSVALISDAGTPAISDPGYRLVAAAVAAGIKVKPIPGPNAITTLLSVAGIAADQYVFVGFFPRKPAAFLSMINELRRLNWPICGYESPNRILDRLEDLVTLDPDAFVCVGKELTKTHETIWRGSVADVLKHLKSATIKGEFSVIIWPSGHSTGPIDQFVDELKAAHLSGSQILEIGTRWAGFSRNQLYERIKK